MFIMGGWNHLSFGIRSFPNQILADREIQVFIRRGRHLADGDSGLERHEPSSQAHEKLRKRIHVLNKKHSVELAEIY
jgi:hypothetical protein